MKIFPLLASSCASETGNGNELADEVLSTGGGDTAVEETEGGGTEGVGTEGGGTVGSEQQKSICIFVNGLYGELRTNR